MIERFGFVALVAMFVCLFVPGTLLADFYESFTDGDPNGDPNWPADPNQWDIDNPDWWLFNPLGNPTAWNIVGDYKALRLWANQGILPVGAFFALPEDLDEDPNTSETYWDDTTNHYVICNAYYPGDLASSDPNDPNNDKGSAQILIHVDDYHWKAFNLGWSFHNCAYVAPGEPYSYEEHHHFTQQIEIQSINGPGGVGRNRLWIDPNGCRDPWSMDSNTADANDTMWLWPPEPKNDRDPNYDDPRWLGVDFDSWERQGFWMVMQFEQDPNTDSGDPNGKFIRGACWIGDKYDWDGEWMLDVELITIPWEDGDPLDYYAAEGKIAVGALSSGTLAWGAGFPADVAYDDIEGRMGIFTNVARTVDLTIKTGDKGQVTIDPDLADPNDTYDPNTYDPNDPDTYPENRLLRYTDGTEIVMVSTPVDGKSFKMWKIFDPNHPGDANHITQDSNAVLYLTMDADYEVQAIFKCGSSEMLPPVGMVLLMLTLGVIIRRAV